MKKIVENNVLRKIIIIPVIVFILLTFAMPMISMADTDKDDDTSRGIMDWIINIITSIPIWLCDVVNQVVKAGVTLDASELVNGTVYTEEDEISEWLKEGKNGPIEGLPNKTAKMDGDIDKYAILKLSISPAEIFSNKIALLDADYFSTEKPSEGTIGKQELSLASQLKETIASWYKAFRLISIVGLLSVLVYLGIRIIISAAASDKAKYKSMFADWVVALCLIFFLHYIMAFTNIMVNNILNIMGNSESANGFKQVNITIEKDGKPIELNGNKVEYSTSLMGYVRLYCESIKANGRGAYSIMYVALTGYTLYFIILYIKRALILTVLTMIAPLIALTYPIDKVKDGQAQAFSFWLREYVMNSIQPIIHLTLYTVLVSSAMDLAVQSPIYAICALAFIVPGEKLIKDMFGFRSNTAPSLGKMTAAHTLANWITKKGSGALAKVQENGANKEKIRTTDQNPTDSSMVQGSGIDALAAGGSSGPQPNPQPSPQPSPQPNPQPNPQLGPQPSPQSGTKKKKISNNAKLYMRKKFNVQQGHSLRGVAKVVGKGLGKGAAKVAKGISMGSGAVLGLAGGLISGDMTTAITGMTAGAKAGGVLADRAMNKASGIASGAWEMSKTIRYGDKELQNREADKAFKNDIDNRQHLLDKGVSEEDLDNRLDEYAEYRRTGVTDIKEMDKLHEIREEMIKGQGGISHVSEENAKKQTLELAKLSTKYDSDTFKDNGKRTNAEQALARKFLRTKDANGNKLNAQQASKASRATMDRIARIKGE